MIITQSKQICVNAIGEFRHKEKIQYSKEKIGYLPGKIRYYQAKIRY